MNFIEFSVAFLLMIVFACGMIAGFYIITRGDWYVNPDNTWKTDGMIFKSWSLFWEQPSRKRPEVEIFYSGEQLAEKWNFLNKVRPDLAAKYIISPLHKESIIPKGDALNYMDLAVISDLLGCRVSFDGPRYFRLYKVEYRYMFPSWIRKPISQCPPCMSSIYGSAYYWFSVSESNTVFRWASSPILAKLGFWVIFCLILACANKYVQQKLKL